MSNHGIKISKSGVDVKTATDLELLISSKFPMFKIYEQGTVSLRQYKTQLNGAINDSQTTITVDSTAGFRSGGYIWVLSSSGDWECMEYNNIDATHFYIVNRGFLSTTRASANDNAQVVSGQNEHHVAHGLTFPPVHFVFINIAGDITSIPYFYAEGSYFEAYVTDSVFHISYEFRGFNGGAPIIPSGAYTQFDFIYLIMGDSITTPYY